MAGKKAPVQNVQQNAAPWGPQQGFLTRGHQEANRILNNRTEHFYPGQTYATFSPQTENALNLTEQRALAGSPAQRAGIAELERTLNGNYLHGGAGFNAAYQAAANRIIPDIESRFNRGGRFGSGLAREAEAKALADTFAEQYQNERQNQMRAMFAAPQMAQQDYNDLAALAGVGQQREGQAQSAIDEAMARHDFNQNLDAQKIAQYMGIISGQLGHEGFESTTGFAGNRGAGVLGGALGGGRLASMFGTAAAPTGPWGTGIGAGLGALAGLF